MWEVLWIKKKKDKSLNRKGGGKAASSKASSKALKQKDWHFDTYNLYSCSGRDDG